MKTTRENAMIANDLARITDAIAVARDALTIAERATARKKTDGRREQIDAALDQLSTIDAGTQVAAASLGVNLMDVYSMTGDRIAELKDQWKQ